jgi:SNF2 family DNA or RNA helicase
LDYTENTWEFIEDMEDEERHLSILERAKQKIAVVKDSSLSSAALSPILPTNQSNQFQEMDAEMLAVSNIELRSYQVDGINWLMYQWATKQKGAILGDEMGLGKTIQSIAFIETLRSQHLIDKPVIIVAPVSTIGNWQKEFEEHSDASVVVYNGTQENREKIHLHEFIKISDSPKSYITNFDVLLTTYSFATTSILKQIGWSCIIIGNTTITTILINILT